jgi:7-cyano-7-deazaguanine synthase in queuosine biosynthesis
VYGWAYQKLYRHRAERALWCIFNTKTVTLDVYEVVPSADAFRLFELQAEATWEGISKARYDGCGTCDLCAPKASTMVSDDAPSFVWSG